MSALTWSDVHYAPSIPVEPRPIALIGSSLIKPATPDAGPNAVLFSRTAIALSMAYIALMGSSLNDKVLADGMAPNFFGGTLIRPQDIAAPEDRQALDKISQGLLDEQIESGFAHHLEPAAERYVRDFGSTRLADFIVDSIRSHKPEAASLLILVSRLQFKDLDARKRIVYAGLGSRDLIVRDAAVNAVEAWGDRPLFGLLRTHNERSTWLSDYIRRLLQDSEHTVSF